MEIMAEDWVCLELGMRLRIGVLRYMFSKISVSPVVYMCKKSNGPIPHLHWPRITHKFCFFAFCTTFNLLTPIFMLPYIIMDLPIFVIAEWATLLVDIHCPQGGS